MQLSPFSLLHPFDSFIDLRLLTREDDVGSDADIARVTGQKNVVGLRQEHGNTAHVVREASSRMLHGDALFTDIPHLTLSIRFADCQNAVIVVPEKKIIGLVHAGWRGVQCGIMTSAYNLLQSEWGVAPTQTWLGLGPALCLPCSDFTDPAEEVPELAECIDGRCIDLRRALDTELDAIGVPKTHIERLPDCTRCHPERYFTYRGGDRELVQNGKVNCLAVTLD